MDEKIKALRQYIEQLQKADGKSVLEMLYEYHFEHQAYDNKQIRSDFRELYLQMHGMPLKKNNQVIDAVCDLCRDYEQAGFEEGFKPGIHLLAEIG